MEAPLTDLSGSKSLLVKKPFATGVMKVASMGDY